MVLALIKDFKILYYYPLNEWLLGATNHNETEADPRCGAMEECSPLLGPISLIVM